MGRSRSQDKRVEKNLNYYLWKIAQKEDELRVEWKDYLKLMTKRDKILVEVKRSAVNKNQCDNQCDVNAEWD